MHWLSNLDLFGIHYTPRINKNKSMYQSKLGGLATLIVYSLALCYCIYKFYLWQTMQLPPYMTSQTVTELLLDAPLDSESIQFSIKTNTSINPFERTAMIVIPIVQKYVDTDLVSTVAVTEFEEIQAVGWGGYVTNASVSKNQTSKGKANTTALVLAPCSDYLLCALQLVNITCAPKDIRTQFLNSYNIFHVDIQIQQFDTDNGRLSTSRNSFFFLMDPSNPVYTQVLLQLTNANVDSGLIFQSIEQSQFISDYKIIPQTISPTFAAGVYGLEILMATLFRMDMNSNILTITRPKLGNILADIGSILKILLLLKLIVAYCNENFMLDDFYDEIIGYYYPEYKKVKSISINGKQVADVPKMYQYLKRLKSEAKLKLTVLNTVYEISRLQFIVNSIQSREALLLSHQVGIKLRYSDQLIQFGEVQYTPCQSPKEHAKFEDQLNDDDFNLLALNYKDRIANEVQFRGAAFYQLNQVTT